MSEGAPRRPSERGQRALVVDERPRGEGRAEAPRSEAPAPSGAAARPPTDRELRLQALKRRFLAEAAAEHLELERLLAAGLEAGSAPARRFRKVVHDLRGSGGSYGYPGITAAAGRLEERLRDGVEPAALAPALAALGLEIAAAGGP